MTHPKVGAPSLQHRGPDVGVHSSGRYDWLGRSRDRLKVLAHCPGISARLVVEVRRCQQTYPRVGRIDGSEAYLPSSFLLLARCCWLPAIWFPQPYGQGNGRAGRCLCRTRRGARSRLKLLNRSLHRSRKFGHAIDSHAELLKRLGWEVMGCVGS